MVTIFLSGARVLGYLSLRIETTFERALKQPAQLQVWHPLQKNIRLAIHPSTAEVNRPLCVLSLIISYAICLTNLTLRDGLPEI